MPNTITTTFSYTGSEQTFTVPTSVSSITVTMTGGAGGTSTQTDYDEYTLGGHGGYLKADINVTSGNVIYIYVGGKGTDADENTTSSEHLPGGFNGGGQGGKDDNSTTTLVRNGSGGGGASDLRIGGNALSNRIMVVGGGGGSGYSGYGGGGGGSTGGNGDSTSLTAFNDDDNGIGGYGGTQSNGGDIDNTRDGDDGELGNGGNAGAINGWGAGGGGGGYYGGSSGSTTADHPNGYPGGGGGGSSYVDEINYVTTVHSNLQGYSLGNTSGYSNDASGSITFVYDLNLALISSTAISTDNTTLTVTFDEEVYNSSSGNAALEVSDFSLSISGGDATLSSTTPTSISTSDNITFQLGISISGTATGDEVLTVSPVSNSIYNSSGFASDTTQTNNTINLVEKVLPYITGLVSDSNIVEVTFSEAVFSSSSGTGTLTVNDFDLSLTGGTATLTSTLPSDINISDDNKTFTLTVPVSGISDGSELITINPQSNSIFDSVGNIASTTQSNNTFYLPDLIGPKISSVTIDSTNSELTVTFNENIYSDTSLGTSFTTSMFSLSKSGGTATLDSTTPSSIDVSNSIVTLGISLSGTADGSETITVSIVSSSTIFDNLGQSASESQSNNEVNMNDKTLPIISGVSLSSDNSELSVTVSELIYNTNSGSGSLTTSSFSLYITGGDATISSTPSSISVSSSGLIYTLGLSLTGTPTGLELLTILPTSSTSVYDVNGNAMSTTQSNNFLYLNDQSSPYITAISVDNTNTSVTVTFSEAVFNSTGGTGNLEISDFELSLSGGNATLDSTTPTSITKSSSTIYILGFTITGSPDGEEVLTVTPISNSIYDSVQNPASTTQTNNTDNLTAPRVSSLSISNDNTELTIVFNSSVFNTSSGSGTLETSDFTLSLFYNANSGVVLNSTTPTSISGSGTTYVLGLSISGTPNGEEVITVLPASNTSIYDEYGNATDSTNQDNNEVNLVEKIAPTISSTSIDSDNNGITVVFSENVFDTSGGTGDLEISDFSFNISGGTATLNSTTPSSITTITSSTTFLIGLDINGVADGQEQITVNPVTDSIFDQSGNVASTSQTNNTVTLNEKIVPVITNVVNNLNNTILTVTFNEAIYNSVDANSDVEVSDFDLSLSNNSGEVTLSSTTPSSISIDNTKTIITLGYSITGNPTGNEIISITPIDDSSIFDINGNNASTTQSNNSVSLIEQSLPTITNTIISSDNKFVTVTFDDTVYSTNQTSGDLDVNDFSLTLINGYSSLITDIPFSISSENNSYILGVQLSDFCDGQEELYVTPVYNSIFDSDGNAADPSNQTNNRVQLNHTLGPLINNIELSSDYTAVLVDFSENVFADISQGTSSYLIDSSDLSSGIVYNYPSNFQEILVKSTSQTLTAYSSLSNLDRILISPNSGNTYLKVDDSFDLSFNSTLSTYDDYLKSLFQLVEETSIDDLSGYYRLDNDLHSMLSLDLIDNKLVLNNAWDLDRNTSIENSSYTGGYVIFSLEFNSNLVNLRPYARIKFNPNTNSLILDNNYISSDSNSINYNTPINFNNILSQSISPTLTDLSDSSANNLDRILISLDSGTTFLSIDDSFSLSFSTSYDTNDSLLKSMFHLVEENDVSGYSGYFRLNSEIHPNYSLDISNNQLIFSNAFDLNRSSSDGYVLFDFDLSNGYLIPKYRFAYNSSLLSDNLAFSLDVNYNISTTVNATYNTPLNFSSIISQSISPTLSNYTSVSSLDRIMISVDGGITFLSIDDSYNLDFSSSYNTYGSLLKSTFHLIEETDITGYTGYYRLDSEMHSNYSIDIVNNQLVLSNAFDINRTSSDGYVLFEIDLTNGYLTPKYRFTYDSTLVSSKIAFSLDTTFSTTNYLYYSNSSISISSYYRTTFTFKTSSINLSLPSDFNPLNSSRVSNPQILFENISPAVTSFSSSYLYGESSSRLYQNTNSVYQPQIEYEGNNSSTYSEAEAMLTNIEACLANEGSSLRYDKELYLAFRTAMLETKLKSYGIINGELDQHCVPFVYFTNETDSSGVYHPFMVIASYSIADKPNRLIDVPIPPGEGGVDYNSASVTRSTTLANYLTKIPLKNYGEITSLTDNDLTSSGTTNLRDDANSSDSYTVYNYSSISSIGITIDGVKIYPVLNNTLLPAQEKAEITNTGIHVGQGLQLHYHADGHGATGNGLNLYNISDYVSQTHPPLIGFAYDGIALFGKYESSYSDMSGYDIALDSYGGHTHDGYGYHYHAHSANSVTEGVSSNSYTLHILLKGAWYGVINDIPEFWNTSTSKPAVTPSENQNEYTGYKDYSGNTTTHSSTTSSTSNYLYYSSSVVSLNSSNQTSFTFYSTDLSLGIPADFNPLSLSRLNNNQILFENLSADLSSLNSNYLYGGSSSSFYSNTNSVYQPQIQYQGINSITTLEAESMLDNIIASIESEGTTLRYDKNLYLSFRNSLLEASLKSYGIINSELEQNCVPYVYFTNEIDDDGIYHPFMVIASYSITEKPNGLIDIPISSLDTSSNVSRNAVLSNNLIKIPLKNYGNISSLEDNDLSGTGKNNLRDNINSSDSYSVYNYTTTSTIGIAIDGVLISPILNENLLPIQESGEISNIGVKVNSDLQLSYVADSYSANNNGLNLYNDSDYVSESHPPLIGFSYDGIALYGQYNSNYSDMSGYDTSLDDYGGHDHDNYGYHYHAHTANSIDEDLSTNDYTLHILLKGAYYGLINDIPDFWNLNTSQPNVIPSDNQNRYTGYKDFSGNTTILSSSTEIGETKYLYYDSNNYEIITDISDNETDFSIYSIDLSLGIPDDFNPLNISRVSNSRLVWENITPTIESITNNSFYDQSNSTFYSSIHSKYQPQIQYSGNNTNTETEASNMLDLIKSTLDNEGTTMRYEKNLYLAFRRALLNYKLKSKGVINGIIDQYNVPFVYFTNETDSDGVYHPFMVISSYNITDKPNRLLDIITPNSETGENYSNENVVRDSILGENLIKIPIKDYGNVSTLLDNDLTINSGYNNLRDNSDNSVEYNNYNYASIKSIGVAIDGVLIYPVLNNNLNTAQEDSQIANTGLSVDNNMNLYYQADSHSANPNDLNLYNIDDYSSNSHPPLIGFGYDGIALYGKYENDFSDMSGYDVTLDSYGGHDHDDYGYHYHAHSLDASSEGLSTSSFNLHILLKGAWYGLINNIPEFWDSGSPSVLLSSNSNQYTGNSNYSITNTSSSTIIASGNLDIYDFRIYLSNTASAYLSSSIPLNISSSGTIYTLGINISGTINGGEELSVYPVNESIYDSSGNPSISSNQKNNNIILVEKINPTITGISVGDDNNFLTVTFSENIFNSSSSTLETSDFNLSISGGISQLLSSQPTSISVTNNIVTLGISLSELANGEEIITVNPNIDSIYDSNGNVASETQSNNSSNLNKKTSPSISTLTINDDNNEIEIDFSEPVYSSANGTGELKLSNFTLELEGGTANLVSSAPLSIYQINPYYLGIQIDGTPNGEEKLNVTFNSIYDAYGNLAESQQTNNYIYLFEKERPYVESLSLTTDNSELTVTFNEEVFIDAEGTTPLTKEYFPLYTNSNKKVLKSLSPSAIQQNSNVYILSLVTNLLPENGDYLKIVLDYNNIYDANGNLIDESKSVKIIPFNQQILSDQQLLSVASQGGRIKKKKIIGNSSKGKYGNSNVNSNASVGSY